MRTLITYPPAFGELSASPFCVKAIYLLNASGLPWQREDSNDPRKAPQGKFPVLRTETGLIHGSDNIADHLAEHGTDPDAALTAQDRATSHAVIRMAEEHLYFLLVLDRWDRDEVWPHICEAYFHEIPALLRPVITGGLRKTLRRGMKSQGLGRMPWSERLARANCDLSAIAARLDDTPYLFGAAPTRADAAVGAILSAITATPVATELARRVADDAVLAPYVARVRDAFGKS